MNARDWLMLLIGANAGFFGVRGFLAGRRRIWRWLQARHEKACVPLNEKWKHRVVRHPLTGRVGMCASVCVKGFGWRDLILPRWCGRIVFSAELAGLLERRAESMEEAIDIGMRGAMLAALGGGSGVALARARFGAGLGRRGIHEG